MDHSLAWSLASLVETLDRIQGWLSLLREAVVMVEITFPPWPFSPFSPPISPSLSLTLLHWYGAACVSLGHPLSRSSLFHYLQQASASITRRARVYQQRTRFLRGYPRGLTCFQRYPKCSSNNPSFRFNLFHTSSHTPVYSIYNHIYFLRTVPFSPRGGWHAASISRLQNFNARVGHVLTVFAQFWREIVDTLDARGPDFRSLSIFYLYGEMSVWKIGMKITRMWKLAVSVK